MLWIDLFPLPIPPQSSNARFWHSQLAFYVNLHRAVIGPSTTLTGRWRPDIDLRRMLTGILMTTNRKGWWWYRDALDPWLPTEIPANALIKLRGCTGWSEYSLGKHTILQEMLSLSLFHKSDQIVLWHRHSSKLATYSLNMKMLSFLVAIHYSLNI